VVRWSTIIFPNRLTHNLDGSCPGNRRDEGFEHHASFISFPNVSRGSANQVSGTAVLHECSWTPGTATLYIFLETSLLYPSDHFRIFLDVTVLSGSCQSKIK